MKKLLIIVAVCTLHVHLAQGMMYGTVKAISDKISKYVDPNKYILDDENKQLYESILEAMDEKCISDLRLTQFPDRNDDLQTFEYTFGRVLERLNTASNCILAESLIQDPIKQKATKLSSIIEVNRLIIPDLYMALALRALQEQKKLKKPVVSSKSLMVDVLLYKITLLSDSEKVLFKSKLQEDAQYITVDQTQDFAEKYFWSLPEEKRTEFLQKISNQKPSSPVININNINSSPKSFDDQKSVSPGIGLSNNNNNNTNNINSSPKSLDDQKSVSLGIGLSNNNSNNNNNNNNTNNMNSSQSNDSMNKIKRRAALGIGESPNNNNKSNDLDNANNGDVDNKLLDPVKGNKSLNQIIDIADGDIYEG